MPKPTKRETATAYHEAGHAVVGFWEQVPTRLLVVSIAPEPDADSLGHNLRGKHPRVRDVELGPDGRPRPFYRDFDPSFDETGLVESRLRPEILMLYAGGLAKKRHTGRMNRVGAAYDMARAADYVDYLVGSPRQANALAKYLWIVAEDAVNLHWPEIEALAAELLDRKTMPGRDVGAYLRSWAP